MVNGMGNTERLIVDYLRGRRERGYEHTTLEDVSKRMARRLGDVRRTVEASPHLRIEAPPGVSEYQRFAQVVPHGKRRVWLVEVEESAS